MAGLADGAAGGKAMTTNAKAKRIFGFAPRRLEWPREGDPA